MSKEQIDYIAHLDPEVLTAKQWRMLFRSIRSMQSLPKDQDEKDDDTDQAVKENSDVVDLQEEKKGKSKAPPVTKDDLREGVEEEEKLKKKAKT